MTYEVYYYYANGSKESIPVFPETMACVEDEKGVCRWGVRSRGGGWVDLGTEGDEDKNYVGFENGIICYEEL